MKYKKCNEKVVKNGKQKNGTQRYYCCKCKLSFQENYVYNAYSNNMNKLIYNFLIEGVGVRSNARLLSISKNTVLSRIKYLASLVVSPIFTEENQSYEVDETYMLKF